jgi:hypothetical protein
MKNVIKVLGIGCSLLLFAALWASPASAQALEVRQFKVKPKKVKLDKPKPFKFKMVIKNTDVNSETTTARVVGMQNGIQVYKQEISDITIDGKKKTKVLFPEFTPTTDGDITWTASVDTLGVAVAEKTATTTAFWKNPPPTPPTPPVSGPGVTVLLSEPANGTYFVAGEAPMITVGFFDDDNNPLSKDDLSTANLYVYGPQDQRKTTTSVKLLRAETDRNVRPHHYIDLLTHPDAVWVDNTVMYPLSAVTDELPGTYTATVWAVRAGDSLQQWMPPVDFQIGTAVAETYLVTKEKCGQCHLGAANGQFYMHHVDGSTSNPNGNRAIDSWPTRTCKSCHNQDGYAAYRDADGNRVPDPIVRRVHGVHIGLGSDIDGEFEVFKSVFGQDDFSDYLTVEFPANPRNCPYCHVDDRWKTQPGQLACGACHDTIWFGDPSATPEGDENHPGGPRTGDADCAVCHTPDGIEQDGVHPIQTVHLDRFLASLSTEYLVELNMSPPANGSYYVAGETPTVHIVVKEAATGAVVDPNTITEADWNRARFQVSGPRDDTMPVLTTAAFDLSKSTSDEYIANDLRVRTNPADEDPRITRSATEITYQLADVAGLRLGTYTVFAQVRKGGGSTGPAGVKVINFQVGAATVEAQIATNCTDCHDGTNMHGSYPFSLAPDICKNCHDYQNQLTGSTGWTDGYWGYGVPPISRLVHGVHFGHYLNKPEEVAGEGFAEVNLEEGEYGVTAIIFPQDVRNCVKCHAPDTTNSNWTEEPNRLACLACHDSDAAIAHGTLQTYDPTPDQPYSGDEEESCKVCHGGGSDLAPSVVHNITDPYVPPYLRDMPPGDF